MHNSYLEVLAEGGVPTLIAFVAFIVGSWRLAGAGATTLQSHDDVDGLRIVAATQAVAGGGDRVGELPLGADHRCRCGCSAGSPRCSA